MITNGFGTYAMDSLGNTQIGGPNAQSVMKYFPALKFPVKELCLYFILKASTDPAGYASGRFGEILLTFMDNSGNKFGEELLIPGLGNLPSNPPGLSGLGQLIKIPVDIPAGLAQIVMTNQDADPIHNFCSIDDLCLCTSLANPQKICPPSLAGVCVRYGTGLWQLRTGYLPIFSASDGASNSEGIGAIERESIQTVGREVLTITSPLQVVGVNFGFDSSAAKLPSVAASISVNEIAVATFSGTVDQAYWLHGYLPQVLSLKVGDVVTLEWTGPCYLVRDGRDYGFHPNSYFQGGEPYYLSNGAWTKGWPFQTGAVLDHGALPFSFETL